MKNPTTRKVLNKGFIPIRYRMDLGRGANEARHGWIIEKLPKYWLVRLIGEETNRRVRPIEWKHVVELGATS